MSKIVITAGALAMEAELNDRSTARKIWDALPIEGRANSLVNIVGRVLGDAAPSAARSAARFRAVKDGTRVKLTREGRP